jgi:hypothetical protein
MSHFTMFRGDIPRTVYSSTYCPKFFLLRSENSGGRTEILGLLMVCSHFLSDQW